MTTYKTLNFTGRRATPVILQTEAAECGLASLAMVGAYHGFDTDLASLRRQFSISLKGATLNDLIRIATQLNLATRPIKAELEDLGKMMLPAILHWDFNHFVVITQANERRVVIHDPARGKRVMALDEVSKHFTGVAMELAPTQEFEPRRKRQQIRFRRSEWFTALEAAKSDSSTTGLMMSWILGSDGTCSLRSTPPNQSTRHIRPSSGNSFIFGIFSA